MAKSGSQGALIGYIQVMKKIDEIYTARLEQVKQLFNETGKEMLLDFRSAQQSAVNIKTKVKGQNENTANQNVSNAIDYARRHSGSIKTGKGVPWINRTSRAVRGVNVIIEADSEEISLALSHGIYYGAYLEYGNGRRYAILEPLIRQYTPKLIEKVKQIMGGK